MAQNLLTSCEGRFFRGNLHCHSNKSDGLLKPEDVAAAYRDAGYDFIMLSDHFEARYGWQVTDTRHLRDAGFNVVRAGAAFGTLAVRTGAGADTIIVPTVSTATTLIEAGAGNDSVTSGNGVQQTLRMMNVAPDIAVKPLVVTTGVD